MGSYSLFWNNEKWRSMILRRKSPSECVTTSQMWTPQNCDNHMLRNKVEHLSLSLQWGGWLDRPSHEEDPSHEEVDCIPSALWVTRAYHLGVQFTNNITQSVKQGLGLVTNEPAWGCVPIQSWWLFFSWKYSCQCCRLAEQHCFGEVGLLLPNRKQQHQLNCQVLLVLVLQKCHGLGYLTERGVSDCIDGIVLCAQLPDAVLSSLKHVAH